MTHIPKERIARIAIAAVVVAALLPGRVRGQEAATARTSINTTSAGYLGILSLRCDCTLSTDADVRKRHFTFRSEPVITAIEAMSPGASVLRRGDVVTHIDGHSLLSAEGARRFASVMPGQTVELSLRRNGRATRARISATPLDWDDYRVLGNTTPEAMTGYTVVWGEPPSPADPPTPAVPAQPRPTVRQPRAAVSPRPAEAPPGVIAPATPEAPGVARRARAVIAPPQPARGVVWAMEVPGSSASPRGWFGFSIRCTDCGWSSSDEPGAKPIWESSRHPELSMVAGGSPAARAGLRPGDVLTHIDGVSILTRAGARRFGGVEPGQKVRVTVLRDGRAITRELTLGRRPEARASAMAGVRPAKPVTPATPAARRELRYTGKLDEVSVEVWSAGAPTVERVGDTMVISVGGTIVRLKIDPRK